MVAGTARARWMWQLAAVCWAEMLPIAIAEADRGLGPMLPSSARELWPFCALRLPDLPGFTTKWLGTPDWWPRVGYRTDQNFEEATCRPTDQRTVAAPKHRHGSQCERCRLGHRVARRPPHCSSWQPHRDRLLTEMFFKRSKTKPFPRPTKISKTMHMHRFTVLVLRDDGTRRPPVPCLCQSNTSTISELGT